MSVPAALAAALTFVVSGMIRGTYPFGDRPRSTNDLGQQFVPMYAHLRDILTGQAPGDLIFNWSSGFGVPFLGDSMAYVGSTLSWIVLVLPRDHIDLALFLVDVAAIGLAAGAMATYLRWLRPTGPFWLAVIGGVSYGACAWAIDDAAYMSVWLNGLVAFPVICLLCEWILRRRSMPSLLVTPFVIALLWTSHFYTVYMATIGAAIVVVARILAYDAAVSWRERLTGALRCMLAVGLGIGLAAPLLLPTFRSVSAARPSPDVSFKPIGALDFLSRLLAGSEGVGSTPGLAVGTLMLLLAISFPFNRAISARERIVWTAVVLLTVGSMQVRITHEVWHGFDSPNGSPFRQAFVIAGMLVIVGWMSVASGVRGLLVVTAPLVLVGILYALTWNVRTITTTTHLAVPLLAATALIAWLIFRRPLAVGVRRGAIVLLLGAVFVEVTLSSVAIDAQRSKILSASSPWGELHSTIRALVQSADDWPNHRTAPGAALTVNDPMLIGGQGSQYYSSTIPDTVSARLLSLGFGYSSYGRATVDPRNPVVDAIFAIGARVVTDPADDAPRLEKYDSAPLVTVRPVKAWTSPDPGPFGAQETALGADVYTIPKLRAEQTPDATVADRGGAITIQPTAGTTGSPGTSGTTGSAGATGATGTTGTSGTTGSSGAKRSVEVRLTARCAPDSEVWLAAPTTVGEVVVDGRGWRPILTPVAKRPGVYTGAPMMRLGTVGADGSYRVELRLPGRTRLPSAAVGCLHRDKLTAAVHQLGKPAEVKVGGHGIDIRLNRGTAGAVVVSVIRIDGWQCSVDGAAARKPGDRAGLMAIPVSADSSKVSCSYRPPGTRLGLALGAGALLGVLLIAAALLVLRRRQT
ncbi:YfhO family protein [Kribbella solani]|uniref:YfhO family protein n=1 Tax=Kribbella solani TaxID=236067 RepID=UPI0029AA2878|nr:YfhO family protein [Kribbella solani]MDX2969441.1 YfhO family protein [Kribbella solani]